MNKIRLRDAGIIYYSALEAIELLETTEKRYEAIKILLDYQLFGEYEPSINNDVNIIVTQAIPNIRSANIRYENACANKKYGELGGRPKEIDRDKVIKLKANNYTNTQIAKLVKCSVSSINRILKEHLGLNSEVCLPKYDDNDDESDEQNNDLPF